MASFKVKPYWKIARRIRGDEDHPGQDGQDRLRVFRGRADGVEIEDLSIDCGFQNQQVVNGKIKANASAIGIGGSHIAVRRCWFKNYGSPYDADTGENFAVFIGSPDPANGENLVVEDCIFAGMSPLLHSGQSVLTLAGGPPKNDLKAGNWARGCIARRNHFTGYHYGCHGITVSTARRARMIIDNVFEHFMGACIYQDTWPMRDMIIANNIMSDVNQGIRLTCDNMNNFQIRDNLILMNDGYDLKDIAGGVVHTDIDHSLVVGNMRQDSRRETRRRGRHAGQGRFVTSVPTRSSFTYSLTPSGKNETGDNAVGGFIQALNYQGCMCPAPEAIVVCGSGGKTLHPPTNFVIDRNVIKPYSSDDTCPRAQQRHQRLRAEELADHRQHCLRLRQSRGPDRQFAQGLHLDGDLPRQLPSRRNAAAAQGRRLKLIPGGLSDLPLSAGQNVTLTPANGRFGSTPEPPRGSAELRLAHAVDPSGPARDHHFAGKARRLCLSRPISFTSMRATARRTAGKRVMMSDY